MVDTYAVKIYRDGDFFTVYVVEAANEKEAKAKALKRFPMPMWVGRLSFDYILMCIPPWRS